MEILTLVISLVALIYIVASNPLKGIARFLAPDSTAATMLVAIFGVRPLFNDRFDEESWYGIYIPSQEGESIALLVGAITMASFTLGALIMGGRVKKAAYANTQKSELSKIGIRFTAHHILAVTICATVAYVGLLTVLAGPGIFNQLRNGRSTGLAIGGVPEIVMMVPLSGSIAVALFLLTNKQRRINGTELLIALTAIISSVMLLSQLGNRRFIIPAVLIPIIASLIRRPVRVKLWHVAATVASILILAILPMVRSAGARRPGEGLVDALWRYLRDEGFTGTIRPVFASYDTEMFDFIAIVAPTLEQDRFGLGRGTLLEFMTRPLPGSWVPGTPWSEVVLTQFFGGGCGNPVCPVASYPGVLFFDGGFVLVALGSIAMGAFLRLLAIKLRYNKHLSTTEMLYIVIAASFSLVAMRTNTVHAAWWALYTMLIAFSIYTVVSFLRTRPPQSFRHRHMPTAFGLSHESPIHDSPRQLASTEGL